MRIIPLSEGTFTIDQTKRLVPFDASSHQLTDRPVGSLLVEIQPFVVITSKDVLLLDTGLGLKKEGVLQLHRNLMDNGINPGEVTKVLLSHLHKDHAGAVGMDEGPAAELSFPHALYYVQRAELDYAFEKGSASFAPASLECLRGNPQVQLLDGNGETDGYIRYEVTGAHSPHHQAFWIQEENEIIFFGGDEAPQLQQMKHRFVAKYDADGKKAMELRRKWWQLGEVEGWTFLFYHDVKHPSITFPGLP
ncbi:MAG: MBL fold metallo-hydrolase [Sphingobacteriales bacterium]|nr:MBL fold metallo-hydrolase [Sphingobacteriales bacterium]